MGRRANHKVLIKLSDSSINRVPQPKDSKARKFLNFDSIDYLKLRVTSTSKKFYFLKTVNGKQRKTELGTFPQINSKEALEKANDALKDFNSGKIVYSQNTKKKLHFLDREITTTGNDTLGDLVEAYVDLMEKQGKSSFKDVRACLYRYVKPYPEVWNHPANLITKQDVIALLKNPLLNGHDYARNKVVSYLKTAFNTATQAEDDEDLIPFLRFKIESNPLVSIKKKPEIIEEIVDLSTKQYRILYKLMDTLPHPYSVYGKILMLSGQRIKQIMRTEKKDYYPMADIPHIKILDTKGNIRHEHKLPITKHMKSLIEELNPFQTGYLFEHELLDGEMRKMREKYINEIIFKPLANTMIENGDWDREPFTYRNIRKSVASRLREYDVPNEVVEALCSHGKTGVAQKHYDAWKYRTQTRKALETLESRICN